MSSEIHISRDIQALLAYIDERSDWVHSWERGRDCVSFSLGGVEAMTGVDLLSNIATWSNRFGALRVATRLGGLEKALDDRMDPVAPAFAKRGDVAGLPDESFGVRLMIVEGATLVGPGEVGLERLPRRAMECAWRAETAQVVAP